MAPQSRDRATLTPSRQQDNRDRSGASHPTRALAAGLAQQLPQELPWQPCQPRGPGATCHGPRLPPTKPGIDIRHSLAQRQVNEAPAQAEMGEDNEQLPQHGIEPEQHLKHRKAGQSGVGSGPSACSHAGWSWMPLPSRTRGRPEDREDPATRLAAAGICQADWELVETLTGVASSQAAPWGAHTVTQFALHRSPPRHLLPGGTATVRPGLSL